MACKAAAPGISPEVNHLLSGPVIKATTVAEGASACLRTFFAGNPEENEEKQKPHQSRKPETNAAGTWQELNEQAAVGFEPTNNGFAIRPLGPLGYAAARRSVDCLADSPFIVCFPPRQARLLVICGLWEQPPAIRPQPASWPAKRLGEGISLSPRLLRPARADAETPPP